MTEKSLLFQIPGGSSAIEWFGREPKFHDAEVLDIRLMQNAASSIRLLAWNNTDFVDEDGYFLTEKHAIVDIVFQAVDLIELSNFGDGHKGIVFSLEFTGSTQRTEVSWTSSVGVEGRIVGRGVSISVSPHQPAEE